MKPIPSRIGAVLVLTAGVVGVTALHPPARAEDKDDLAARIDKRIQAWQPTKDERRLDEIGWAADIRDALRLAKDNNRPIFLFTYSGDAQREHAMALQRC
jgi:hypothetical protein